MSLNKVMLIGRVGKEPEARTFQDGGEIVNLTLATSERWTDKATKEKKEKTDWHNISVKMPGLVGVCKSYVHKGSRIYVEGKIQTRKYQKDGQERYLTEIVATTILLLDSRDKSDTGIPASDNYQQPKAIEPEIDDLDDSIPF